MDTVLLGVIAGLLAFIGTVLLLFLRDVKQDVRDLRAGMNDALHGIRDLLAAHGERIAKNEERTSRMPFDIDRRGE